MKASTGGRDRLKEALSRAYLAKKPPEIDERWRRALMARVREIGPLDLKPLFLPSFEKLVWRLVPVTTPLIVILILFLMKLGLVSGHDGLQSFLKSVEGGWTFTQLFSA